MPTRKYNDYVPYDRTKMPRNKYGLIDNTTISTSVFGNSINTGGTTTVVGSEMPNIEVFMGATNTEDGVQGLVPAPTQGQNNWYYLRGTGGWDFIPAAKWIKEFPYTEGLTKTGVGVQGDFNVTNNLTTNNLTVTGQAHFFELVIDKVKAQGGEVIISPSFFEIDFIADGYVRYNFTAEPLKSILTARPDISYYKTQQSFSYMNAKRVWMRNDDSKNHIENEVQVGDMLRCRTFNLDGYYNGNAITSTDGIDYWTFVLGTGSGSFVQDSQTFTGFYVDLAYEIVTSGNTKYPIGTLFQKADDPVVPDTPDPTPEEPEYDLTSAQLTSIKAVAFNTLCGSTSVTTESPVDTATSNAISSGIYNLRGITSISQNILNGSTSGSSNITTNDIANMNATGNAILNGASVADEPNENEPVFVSNRLTPSQRYEWLFGYGTMIIRTGQHLACLGNLYDADRQNAIVISAIQSIDVELAPPSIGQYTGIDVFGEDISQFRLSTMARNGNIFTGNFMIKNGNNYVTVDDKINLYVQDIETGLEKCGIHLDGDNSTVNLIGSLSMHQNGDGTTDTLNVYDENDNLKVVVSPDDIPQVNDLHLVVNKSFQGTNTFSTSEHLTNVDVDWHVAGYKYSLNSSPITLTGLVSVDQYSANDIISIPTITINVNLKNALFRGESGFNATLKTASTSCTYNLYLRRYTSSSSWTNVTSITSQSASISSGVSAFSITKSNWLNNYTLSTRGEYRIYYSVTLSVESDKSPNVAGSKYTASNCFFTLDIENSLYGSVNKISATGAEMLQIGPNGLVYANGANNYFYSGEDGIQISQTSTGNKINMISMTSSDGMKLLKAPQEVTGAATINSELVKAVKSGSSNYTLSFPSTVETGRQFTIIGFYGTYIYSGTKKFQIYNHSSNSTTAYSYLSLGTSYSGAFQVNAQAVQITAFSDGLYITGTNYLGFV